jgi:hypothetical protein
LTADQGIIKELRLTLRFQLATTAATAAAQAAEEIAAGQQAAETEACLKLNCADCWDIFQVLVSQLGGSVADPYPNEI